MTLKCNCVTVRRDFDNGSAGRREVLFPRFPNPPDVSSSEFDIVSLVEASASRVFRAFKIDGIKSAPGFSSRSTRDEEIY